MLPRQREPEVMDDPALETGKHLHALRSLERINRWSRSAHILWRPLRDLARRSDRPLRVLDVATGAGDLPISLWLRAKEESVPLIVDACDKSPTALEHGRSRAKELGADIHFFRLDALGADIPSEYDVIVCSLFLHHLDPPDVVMLLSKMHRAAPRAILINDLVRGTAGLALAWVATRLLSSSDVVHTDGPRSVRAAYTKAEALELAERAGLSGATIQRRWPLRFLLTWQAPLAQ